MAQLITVLRCGIALAAGLAPVAAAQTAQPSAHASTRPVVAGAHYRAGWFHRVLLGSHYRDLWATTVQVEVLDLSRFGGGLTPTGCGGRRQTKSVRFLGGDGRQYVFRSVDKDPTLALPPQLRATFAKDLIKDQISSAHPGGPLVVAPILDAAGVIHVEPRIVLLPDDPRLNGLDCVREGFRLGMIEERPTDPPDNETGFAGALDLASTTKLFDQLESDSRNRVDSRAFLTARLVDVFIGDWDRHQDQWRWARFDAGGVRWWRPIPRDRDQAFARLDGLLVHLAGYYWPQLIGFGDDYPSIWRLTYAGQVLDRRLLQDVEKPVWDSIARTIQSRLTDTVIALAVGRLPPEYFRQNGAALTRALRRRRDHLLEASDRFYRLLAGTVSVHGTDERDVAEVERLAGGRVAVRLASRAGAAPFFSRTFDRRETGEIRLYLHGKDDRLTLRGSDGSGPMLRVVGGGGEDELVDSSRAGTTHFYDEGGHSRFVSLRGASVDRSHYNEPPPDTSTLGRPRDWGSRWLPLTWLGYTSDLGLFVGTGADGTVYGFRRLPYATHLRMRGGYATTAETWRAEFTGEFRGLVAPAIVTLHLRGSGMDVLRFYGFGNETSDSGSSDFYKVRQQQYLVSPRLEFAASRSSRISFGPVFKIAHTNLNPGTFVAATRPYGAGDWAEIGAAADVRVDTRDNPVAARRGVALHAGGSYYPKGFDIVSGFGEGHVEASVHLTPHFPLRPTLAMQVAAKKVWGTYPFYEAAYIGGATTVRGFVEHRFAGDAAVYGNVELRLPVGTFFFLLPTKFGVFGLSDAGRVYLAGETSDRWHTAAGGGLWFSFLSPVNTLSVAAASSGEGTRVIARIGFGF